MPKIFRLVAVVCLLAVLARAEVQPGAGKDVPNRIRPNVVVLSAEWTSHLPPTERVNAPEFLAELYPGQAIALGIMAEGPDRDSLLKGISVHARFASGENHVTGPRELKFLTTRRIKAEGADFVLMALKAAGISDRDRAETEQLTSSQTLAVFAADWTVPMVEQSTEVEISVTVSGTVSPIAIEPARLKIRTTGDWLNVPPPTQEEVGKQMNRFHADMAPGQLLVWFSAVAKGGQLKAPPMQAFFAAAFKSSAAARAAAVAAYPTLDPEIQPALLWVLRLGGHDLQQLFPTLSVKALAPLGAIEPLADPRKLPRFLDPVDPQAVSAVGHTMDRCWAGWMATGDTTYLRALVDLLAGAPDYPAYKSWQESRGGAKGLNAKVARGLVYQIAGWSIGSFQRTDPYVTDWLSFWQNDPAVSATIRQEIAALPGNPAFRRK